MTIRRRRLPFSSRTLSLYHEKHIEFRGIKSEAIQTGYRWRYSFKDSLLSLFVLHNDTWNIWTHILAFLCFSYLVWKLPAELPENASTADTVVFSFYLITAQICFLLSSIYHLLRCMSQQLYNFWYMLDLSGICLLITGSYVIGIHNGFYCDQRAATGYLLTLGLLLAIAMLFTLYPKFQDVEYDNIRITSLTIAVAFGLIPSVHWLIRCQHEECPMSVLWHLVVMFLFYGIGFVFFATKFPEAYFPGNFDLHLSSHQWWHIMVFLAAFVWTFGSRDYFQWRLLHQYDVCDS